MALWLCLVNPDIHLIAEDPLRIWANNPSSKMRLVVANIVSKVKYSFSKGIKPIDFLNLYWQFMRRSFSVEFVNSVDKEFEETVWNAVSRIVHMPVFPVYRTRHYDKSECVRSKFSLKIMISFFDQQIALTIVGRTSRRGKGLFRIVYCSCLFQHSFIGSIGYNHFFDKIMAVALKSPEISPRSVIEWRLS